jgi:hypothetical protein
MSPRSHSPSRIPLAVCLLAVTTSLWAQSPIISQASIGPTVKETGTTDPFPSPNFGATVAISGRTAMASIPGDLATDPNEFGRVAVFEKTATGWIRTATLFGTLEAGGTFGERIDIEGDRAVIGGPKAIYLFEHHGSRWVQTAKVVLTSADTFFGREIALEHGVILASCLHQDDDISESFVHVYEHLRRGILSRTAVIRPRNGLAGEDFGTGLALDGRLLVVGAPHGQGPGAAYVYWRLGRRWIQIDRLMASDATASDRFGESVDVRAGVIVVGAPGADLGLPEMGTGPLRGNAYVFRPARYGWYESQKINEPGVEWPYVGIGANVAMGRGLLALSQNDNLFQISNAHRVQVFDWVDGRFQSGQQVVSMEDAGVSDIDFAGRTLIVSTAVPDGRFFYYVFGDASILVFGRDATN